MCILPSAVWLYRRGRMPHQPAKFGPGINTLAPPMAGSGNKSFSQFLRLETAGAYFALGCLSSGALDALADGQGCAAILGGLLAWKKSGLPVEQVPRDELMAFSAFD